MLPRMVQTGQQEGINFSYGGFVGNTFDSHRIIWKAREVGGSELQDKVVESLFKAYFEEEKSLGDQSVLIECAVRANMDKATATELFQEDEKSNNIGKKEVMNEMVQFRNQWQVSGVPFFIIDGKHALSGAQPPNEILAVLDEHLLDEQKAT